MYQMNKFLTKPLITAARKGTWHGFAYNLDQESALV